MKRPIHRVIADTKARPAVILTRDEVRPYRAEVTVAPITATVRGLASEVPVGPANGIDHESVVLVDNAVTIDAENVGSLLGYLDDEQERQLAQAILYAFDLKTE